MRHICIHTLNVRTYIKKKNSATVVGHESGKIQDKQKVQCLSDVACHEYISISNNMHLALKEVQRLLST